MASAELETIKGVWGQSPHWGPGAEPLVGAGVKLPLKLKAFQTLDVEKRHQIIITINLVSHKLIPRISITNSVPSPWFHQARFLYCSIDFSDRALGTNTYPSMHLQQVTTALIIITSHYEFR